MRAVITTTRRSFAFRCTRTVSEEYERAAHFLNTGAFDVVSLQHEFGIFGGDAGGHIMTLLADLAMPIVTTLHTVLAQPSPAQRRVLREIAEVSTNVIVMAEKGRQLLRSEYGVAGGEDPDRFRMGFPTALSSSRMRRSSRRGFSGRAVILTFGLISPNKGIEVMIEAMPAILRTRADAVYVVLGATHPNLVRSEGETYRESLKKRTRELGIEASCRVSRSVRRSGDARRLHLDVRCVCHALSQ